MRELKGIIFLKEGFFLGELKFLLFKGNDQCCSLWLPKDANINKRETRGIYKKVGTGN